MDHSQPIITAPLFPELSRRFVVMLESLSPGDWKRPVSPTWRVRDVAAHLLDGSLRRLSTHRDGYVAHGAGPKDFGYESLLSYLNDLNADWVRASARLSPQVLTALIRWSDEELARFFASLDPSGPAPWPVAWAGEAKSSNWFDIAREYTEKWHHAQQIFEAVGRESTIREPALMHPFLDTLMRGLPNGLRACLRPDGTAVRVRVTGDAGGDWWVARMRGAWSLTRLATPAHATVTMNQDDAWKIMMKRMPAADARVRYGSVRVEGDQQLADAILETVCVMA